MNGATSFINQLSFRINTGRYFDTGRQGNRNLVQAFDGNGGCFAAADAQGCHAATQTTCFQGVEQGHDQAGTAGANGVAERASTTVDVELVVRNAQFAHGRHGYNGEGNR